MSNKIKFDAKFDDEYTIISVPEYEGFPIINDVEYYLLGDCLDIEQYCYTIEMEDDTFSAFFVQKTGGGGMTPKGDQWYEELTKDEAYYIVSYVLSTTLNIENFELETDYNGFLDANPIIEYGIESDTEK